MKRLRLFGAAALIIMSASLAWVGLAGATSFRSGDNVTTASGGVIDESLYAAGRTVNVDGEVNGDVICAGQNVTVNATVRGDVICAAQTLTVNGRVDGDVRLAGQSVTVGGEVTGNASVATQSFVLSSGSKVGRDLSVAATDATLNGNVGRDLAVGSESAIITSEIGRDIKAGSDNMKLTSTARVNGDIELVSKNNLSRDQGSVVEGEVTRSEPKDSKDDKAALFGLSLLACVLIFLAMLLTALAIALLIPRILHAVTDQAFPHPWAALGIGFLANLVIPIAVVLLAVTVLGIPLALLLVLLWILLGVMSGPFFAYYLGRLILRNSTSPLLIMLVGAIVLLVVYFIPILGFITMLAAYWIGSGMILQELFQRTPRPAYDLSNQPVRETAAKRTARKR